MQPNTPFTPAGPTITPVRRRSFALLLALCLATLSTRLTAADAPAKETAEAPRKSFNIPAGEAAQTLKTFSEQSGQSILFTPKQVAGVSTKELKGEMSVPAALDRLLAGTPLVVLPTKQPGGYSIRRENQLDPNVSRAIAETSGRPEGKNNLVENAEGEKVIKLDTFEVMGSKLLNMDLPRSRDDARPYVVFGREAIERSGTQNLNEFFKQRLPMNATSLTGNQDPTDLTGSSTSSVNLRGLGPNQTLILVDGRRIPNINTGSITQGDVNGIPLSAIERIEVLPSTASAIYGGGATGGVVNIILRRNYVGAEIKLSYENALRADTGLRRVDVAAGFSLEKGKTNVLLSASWSDSNSNFLNQDSPHLYERGLDAIIRNNPGFIYASTTPPAGTTANIRSANGSNLVLKDGTALNSPITFAPVGYLGVASDGGAALVANAGNYNLEMLTGRRGSTGMNPLLSYPKAMSAGATIRRQFSDVLQIYLDVSASNATTHRETVIWSAFPTVQVSSLTNPFTTPIRVRVPIVGADGVSPAYTMVAQSRRATAGILVQLPAEWKASLDLTWGRSAHGYDASQILVAAGTAAFNTGVFDALRDPFATPELVLGAQYFGVQPRFPRAHTTLTNPSLRLTGPLFVMPAGEVQFSGLVDYRGENLDGFVRTASSGIVTARGPLSQEASSGYLETTLPLVGSPNSQTWAHSLSVSMSARYERYRTRGSNLIGNLAPGSSPTFTTATNSVQSFDPSVAVNYEPNDQVKLRASYGTGFLPPSALQLVPNAPTNVTGQLTDPRRGGETVTSWQNNSGGRPGLVPESSTSLSAGIIIQPTVLRGFRLSLDYSRIKKKDNISTFPGSTQGIVDNEALFPERVTRGPVAPGDPFGVGLITSVNSTLFNIARTEVEAIDLQLDQRIGTQTFGTFDFYAVATRTLHFKTQVLVTQPMVENVGMTTSNPLKFRASGGITWKIGAWTAGWNARYFGPYDQTSAVAIFSQGGSRVPHQHYHDLFVSYRIGAGRNIKLLQNTEFTLGVLNVFDRDPPLDLSLTAGTVYYSRFGDPRGTVYQLALKKQF